MLLQRINAGQRSAPSAISTDYIENIYTTAAAYESTALTSMYIQQQQLLKGQKVRAVFLCFAQQTPIYTL